MNHELRPGRNARALASPFVVIAEAMTPSPHTIERHQTLAHAHEVMRAYGLAHIFTATDALALLARAMS